MARIAFGLFLLAGALASAQAAAEPKDACLSPSPEATVAAFRELGNSVADVKVASRARYIALGRQVDLLVYRSYDKAVADKSSESRRLVYRIVVVDDDGGEGKVSSLLPKDRVYVEEAKKATDFKKTDEPKTLLLFTPELPNLDGYQGPPWKKTRLIVIGCGGPNADVPEAKAALTLRRSSVEWSRAIAVALCVVAYLFAATGTYHVHRRQRMDPHDTDPLQPTTGTNYATWRMHLNPVILTAGSNGLGSATKLQVLFFSLLVFGVVTFIWLLTGHLTEMSKTVLMLMGISGFGAVAAAGTELSKNRLDFENWSWLVNRGWLPKGGVAEANLAQWKDIVTTGGEFDATRFQMITFSLLVGGALLTAGSELMDLSSFDIPEAMLGILGLSQVVYIGGKLTAPPAISDLNSEIQKLRKAETDLAVKLSKVNTGSFLNTVIPLVDDPDVQATSVAYTDYLAEWETAKTMFESSLGRLVPERATELRPPFGVPDVVKPTPNSLPDATHNLPYQQELAVSGGSHPYTWTLVKGSLPRNLTISKAGEISGTPTTVGTSRFTLQVTDANGASNSREFTLTVK